MNNRKINIALFWREYDGGVTSINELASALDKDRFNPIFIYLSGFGVDESVRSQPNIYFLSNKSDPGQFDAVILHRLIRILKKEKIDILHCHRHKQVIYGAMASCFSPHPVVLAHVHGLNRTRNLTRRVINFWAFKKITRLIAVSQTTYEDVIKTNWNLAEDKVCVLENSVDYPRFANMQINREKIRAELGLSPQSFVFGTVGRLVPTKGLEYLIEAFAQMRKSCEHVELLLVGDGDKKTELQRLAEKLGCGEFVHFAGKRNNIEQVFRAMDVFVLSSIAEGMPRVILEAMASRIPVVATAVGGIPELVTNNETGLLVPAKDSNALAEAMIRIADVPYHHLTEMIDAAQQRVHDVYSHAVVGKNLANLYENEFNTAKG
ncbi:MAG: glycosyltransferase [Phycisphaerae bacterium]|nr:glycosyltransferase [Phycisphaerae bacterium]